MQVTTVKIANGYIVSYMVDGEPDSPFSGRHEQRFAPTPEEAAMIIHEVLSEGEE